LETVLKNSPHELGESRSQAQRVAIERPLTILFQVSSQDRIVDVQIHLPRR
jgi:hypothetical protein